MLPKHWRSRYDVHHCRLHRRRRDELQRLGVCEALLVKLCVSVLRHVGARPEPGQSAESTANGRGPGPRSPATANQALRGECRGPRRISHLIHHSQKGKTQPTTTRRYGGCHRHRASWRRPGRLDWIVLCLETRPPVPLQHIRALKGASCLPGRPSFRAHRGGARVEKTAGSLLSSDRSGSRTTIDWPYQARRLR